MIGGDALYVSFIRAYAVDVLRLDADNVRGTDHAPKVWPRRRFEAEMEEPFPQDPCEQLAEVLRSMARAWEGTTARLLSRRKGAPADAGLGLLVQEMALGIGQGLSGSGVVQFASPETGEARVTGRWLPQAQGRAALSESEAQFIVADKRGKSLEDAAPEQVAALKAAGAVMRQRLREEMQIEFTLMNGQLSILDAVKCPRSGRAEVAITVALAEDGIITSDEALLRIPPFTLNQLLHRQVSPTAVRDVLTRGIAAAPGAATGRIVFSASAAQAMAAQGEPCILVRRETSPEDIRGMHAAQAVLTERGGMTSHAAVIARGLGLPCVSGATRLQLDGRKKTLTVPGRRVFHEGDIITVDGSTGDVLVGAPAMVEPALGGAFAMLMDWADAARDIGIRANADTPEDAAMAQRFGVDGIGLCRTEHMFFDPARLTVMREMIFAENPGDRAAALDRLLPMQRADFIELFQMMQGQPVTIRLFDPPLHEFLPGDRDGIRALAEALDLPAVACRGAHRELAGIQPDAGHARRASGRHRARDLRDAGPRDLRGDDQGLDQGRARGARDHDPAGFGPTRGGTGQGPGRCDCGRGAIQDRAGFHYRLGVMVETPRAALRAGEIARTFGLLVLWHQRPDADDLWPVARRCGAVHVGLCATGRVPRGPVHPA
jgi:pyruvate, orthophosphate dikinase